jgi:hypothetical protein
MKTLEDKKEPWEYGLWYNIWQWFDFVGLMINNGLVCNKAFYPNLLAPGEYTVLEVVKTEMDQFRLDLKTHEGKTLSLLFVKDPEITKGVPFKKGQRFKILSGDEQQGRKYVIAIL